MNEVSIRLMAIVMRNGIEIWVEGEKTKKLQDILGTIQSSTFIHFEEQTINTADIVGIFSPSTMDEHLRRKNGQWKCQKGEWHDKGQKCTCRDQQQVAYEEYKKEEFFKRHGYYRLP